MNEQNTQINLEGMVIVYSKPRIESNDLANAIFKTNFLYSPEDMVLRVVKDNEGYFARIYIDKTSIR